MDTRLLRAFITLAETENYHEASLRLFVTQPALTKQIKQLEKQLNLTLFERGRHGAKLTAKGQLLLPKATLLLTQTTHFLSHASELSEQLPQSLSVGFGISTFHEASFFVAQLRQRLEKTNIYLDDMPSSEMEKKLNLCQLDVAFIRRPNKQFPSNLISKALTSEVLALAVATKDIKNHTIADYLTQNSLLFLRKERGPGLNEQINLLLNQMNISVKPAQEANDIQTLIALVAAGVGISLVPYSARLISREDVTFIPINNIPEAMWHIDVIWLASLPQQWQKLIPTLIQETQQHFAKNRENE